MLAFALGFASKNAFCEPSMKSVRLLSVFGEEVTYMRASAVCVPSVPVHSSIEVGLGAFGPQALDHPLGTSSARAQLLPKTMVQACDFVGADQKTANSRIAIRCG